jgi:protein-L-isoaspartate(D-aspartate) O-methyltransferase
VAGYPSIAPYDTIIINGAIECLNKALIEQLKEGGKIITVKLDSERSASSKLGRVTVIQKMNDTLQEQVLMDAHTQLLPGFDKKVKFSL